MQANIIITQYSSESSSVFMGLLFHCFVYTTIYEYCIVSTLLSYFSFLWLLVGFVGLL